MKKIIFTYIAVLIIFSPTFAQKIISPGSETYKLIEQALQHLYNTEIEEAARLAEHINQLAPGHPVYPMLRALAIRAAYFPIDTDSREFASMKEHLYETLEKSEDMLEEDKNQPEANFFALASYGLLAMYENQDSNYFKASGLAKEAYKYLKRGFELKEKYPEFYFSTGLYNYYREKYPELHPVYRPFTWFFKSGNMELGLEQMERSSRESVFMQAEALDYLTHIYLRYESKPDSSIKFARSLIEQYPENLHFITLYIDASIASEKFQGLNPYIARLRRNDRPYYKMLGELFMAMTLEKKENKWQASEEYYKKSLTTGKGLKSDKVENYRSYAYAGLARIALHEKKYDQAEKLYQQALAAAHYPHTEKEPKEYLN